MKQSKEIFKRVAIGAMAVFMLLPTFVSCKKKNSDDNSTSEVSTTGEAEAKDVLEGVNFGGKSLDVLYWKSNNLQEYMKEYDAVDEINQMVYERNKRTEEQLGLSVTWNEFTNGGGRGAEFVKAVEEDVLAGGGYDVICSQNMDAGTLTVNGMYSDLKRSKYMDFSSPWWRQKLLQDCTIYDKLYFCTGDISTNLIFMSSVIFFNKTMVENNHINESIEQRYGVKSLYELVESGLWTYEAMFSLSQDIWTDNDNNKEKSFEDTFGFGTYGTLVDNFYYGAGYKMIDVDSDGLRRSSDYTDKVEQVESILTLCKNFFEKDGALDFNRLKGENYFDIVRNSFKNNKLMFSMAPASHAKVGLYNAVNDLRYGVLPVPKYTVDQEGGYSSVLSNQYSMYGVSIASSKADAASAYLQGLGKYSYELTRPVIYEKTMKGKFSEKSEDARMWECVEKSQTFDLGRIFAESFRGTNASGTEIVITTDQFAGKIHRGTNTWQSSVDAWRVKLGACCNNINAQLKKIAETN